MENVFKICMQPNKTLFDVLKNLENEDSQIVLIINEDKKLLGTISDGDIRRGLLMGVYTNDSIEKCMYTNPIVGYEKNPYDELNRYHMNPYLYFVTKQMG